MDRKRKQEIEAVVEAQQLYSPIVRKAAENMAIEFNMPSNYPKTLSKNAILAQSSMTYLCVSYRLANLQALKSVSSQSCDGV
jgi:hypothetical protein